MLTKLNIPPIIPNDLPSFIAFLLFINPKIENIIPSMPSLKIIKKIPTILNSNPIFELS